MTTYTQFSNQSRNAQCGLLPTRQQLEKFLQSKGIPARKLGQMSTWEQIQLTHEYQQLAGLSSRESSARKR
jgi:hypothetical protein